jgi:hypothetical protein
MDIYNNIDANSSSTETNSNDVGIVIQNEDITIDTNIESDESLLHYQHSPDILHEDTPYRFDRCDSPVSLSNYGSNQGSSNYGGSVNSDGDKTPIDDNHIVDNKSHVDDIHIVQSLSRDMNSFSLTDIANITQQNLDTVVKHKHKSHYKELKLTDIERNIDKYYTFDANKYTNEIDILTTFMKGQKNIFIQSKQLTQLKLNCLMIPALLLTCGITIITPFFTCNKSQVGVLSGLNALVALIISTVNYLKLETHTQNYLHLANQYDKLETLLEMTNSKLLIIENETDKKELVLQKINEMEQKIVEMKDATKILVPEEIKTIFPIACHMNIFSFIKKLHYTKKSLVYNLRDLKNEIRSIEHKWKKESYNKHIIKDEIYIANHNKEAKRIQYLFSIKEQVKTEIIESRNVYGHLDEIFTREIKRAEKKMNNFGAWYICFWNYSNSNHDYRGINPVIDKYFQFIYADD